MGFHVSLGECTVCNPKIKQGNMQSYMQLIQGNPIQSYD